MKKIILLASLFTTAAFAQQKPDAVIAACSELAARAERTAMTDSLGLVKYADELTAQIAAREARIKDLEAQLAKTKEPAPVATPAPENK